MLHPVGQAPPAALASTGFLSKQPPLSLACQLLGLLALSAAFFAAFAANRPSYPFAVVVPLTDAALVNSAPMLPQQVTIAPARPNLAPALRSAPVAREQAIAYPQLLQLLQQGAVTDVQGMPSGSIRLTLQSGRTALLPAKQLPDVLRAFAARGHPTPQAMTEFLVANGEIAISAVMQPALAAEPAVALLPAPLDPVPREAPPMLMAPEPLLPAAQLSAPLPAVPHLLGPLSFAAAVAALAGLAWRAWRPAPDGASYPLAAGGPAVPMQFSTTEGQPMLPRLPTRSTPPAGGIRMRTITPLAAQASSAAEPEPSEPPAVAAEGEVVIEVEEVEEDWVKEPADDRRADSEDEEEEPPAKRADGSAEPSQPVDGQPAGKSVKGPPRRKPAGNPKISAKNFELKDKARAKKVADVVKFIAAAKAEAGAAELEKGGLVRLLLNACMVVLSESARNIVNLTTVPRMDWPLKEGLEFLLSDEAESLRDLMILEGSFAIDLLTRQAGRKALARFRDSLSPVTSRLPGLEQLSAVRLPFLIPTEQGTPVVVVEPVEVVLNKMVPVLNKDEEAHVRAIIDLVREVFGDQVASVVAGDSLRLEDLQGLVGALTSGTGQTWFAGLREGWVREVESLQAVPGLSSKERQTLKDAIRGAFDKVWTKVLRRSASLRELDDASRAAAMGLWQ